MPSLILNSPYYKFHFLTDYFSVGFFVLGILFDFIHLLISFMYSLITFISFENAQLLFLHARMILSPFSLGFNFYELAFHFAPLASFFCGICLMNLMHPWLQIHKDLSDTSVLIKYFLNLKIIQFPIFLSICVSFLQYVFV